MYSVLDRKDILDRLEETCKSIEYVDGIILVGSGQKASLINGQILICQ